MDYRRVFISYIIVLILIGYSIPSFAQFNFVYDNSIPVIKKGDTIPIPWAGGMNHPQFSTVDLDFDGIKEIVAFEPGNNLINVFKQEKKNNKVHYTYVQNGNDFFPKDIKKKLQFYDFDKDGKKDLFTYTHGGLKVYKNIGNPSIGIRWELYLDVILSKDSTTVYKLPVGHSQMPALCDIDNDGDMDILSYSPVIKIVQLHKNLSMEQYGNADTLLFELQEPCWGDFAEGSGGNGITLHATVGPCGSSLMKHVPVGEVQNKHMGGGSLLAIDVNNDGAKDLIIGDFDYNNVTLLINGESDPTKNANMISKDTAFPSYDTAINIDNFIVTYYEDMNMDGVKDLIASTNYINNSENTKGVWLYINKGTNTNPNFKLKRKDFLQGDMIENGSASIPVFVDVNQDGLTDLLIANHYNFKWSPPGIPVKNTSKISYYENVGSESSPVFELKNDNWNNFKNSGFDGNKNRVSPAFGDLDGDGDLDMVIGLADGTLWYYENAGGNGKMQFNTTQILLEDKNGNNISVSGYATPELFDLNGDGTLDLIIGQKKGGLVYYRNIGTPSNCIFNKINPDLGQVDVSPTTSAADVTVPRFVRSNGQTYLFAGNEQGTLYFYDGIDGNLSQGDAFHLVSANYLSIDTKGYSAPAVGQIRGDNSFDLLMGTRLGGVWSYRPGDTTFLGIEKNKERLFECVVYPNPNQGIFTIALTNANSLQSKYKIFDEMGRVLQMGILEQEKTIINLKDRDNGLYFLRIYNPKTHHKITKKILLR